MAGQAGRQAGRQGAAFPIGFVPIRGVVRAAAQLRAAFPVGFDGGPPPAPPSPAAASPPCIGDEDGEDNVAALQLPRLPPLSPSTGAAIPSSRAATPYPPATSAALHRRHHPRQPRALSRSSPGPAPLLWRTMATTRRGVRRRRRRRQKGGRGVLTACRPRPAVTAATHRVPDPPLLLCGRASRGRSRLGAPPAASDRGVPTAEYNDHDDEGG